MPIHSPPKAGTGTVSEDASDDRAHKVLIRTTVDEFDAPALFYISKYVDDPIQAVTELQWDLDYIQTPENVFHFVPSKRFQRSFMEIVDVFLRLIFGFLDTQVIFFRTDFYFGI